MKILVVAACVLALLGACGYPDPYANNGSVAGMQTPTPRPGDNFNTGADLPTKTLAGGLQYADVKVGTGKTAAKGEKVNVQYTGWLKNGNKFDSSRDRNQAFGFTIGKGQVIKGWDEGVPGMKVGGIRRLTIPPALAYGPNGSPPAIPGNATLVFLIELVSVG